MELIRIGTRLSIEDSICNLMEPLRKSHHIAFAKIENIPWWCMTIVDFFSGFWDIFHRIETIAREDHDIIFTEKSSLLDESILEDRMPESLRKNWLAEGDHLA